MKHLTILLVLLLVAGMAASGCTSTTADPAPTPDPTAMPPIETVAELPAKYVAGDVVQYDLSNPDYRENGAVLIMDVNGTHYTCGIVIRESSAHAWRVFPGDLVTVTHATVERNYPRHIDRVDPGAVAAWTAEPTPTPTLSPKPTPTKTLDTATMGEKNAAKKALSYLRYSAFSREGLIDQLEYEGFTYKEAVYGVDQSGADWNEQAAKKAAQYLKYSSFSRSGLIDQLEYEGFTPAQAEYGVRAVGY
ncbi:Ltp family lipoprotein [Methanoculleus sp. MH98A]|uniref:Ltp family lipoprotein n=1 Tax=Methanoculleus sp. MH98A TaxID=1495314 RepID=UPI0018CBFDB1|nr:Ltp family lipoprotein [Methanoculleus sp. MH98A]